MQFLVGILTLLYGMLGSSLYKRPKSPRVRLPYSFASHFAPDQLIQALYWYRRNFKAFRAKPKTSYYGRRLIGRVVADTDEEAKIFILPCSAAI